MIPILRQSVSSLSSSSTDDSTSEEEEDEDGNGPVLKTRVDDIIIGDPHISKDTLQQKISTFASCSKHTAVKFNKRINQRCLYRTNQTRVDLKGMKMGNRKPKVDSWKLSQKWGIVIECAKKTIMSTIQNNVRDVKIPLKKRF